MTNPPNNDQLEIVLMQGSSELLKVTQIEQPAAVYAGARQLPSAIARVLGPLVERLPTVAGQAQSTGAYQVVVRHELMKGIVEGNLHWMRSNELADGFRAVVVDAGGKTVGHGTVVPVGSAGQLFAAGFQVGSFIFGQAHLAQINARLEGIEKKLNEVMGFLERDLEGRILGKIRYLQELSESLKQHGFNPVEASRLDIQLESIERELLEIGASLELDLAAKKKAIWDVPLTATLSSIETDRLALEKARDDYFTTVRRSELVQRVRLAAAHMKCALLGDGTDRISIRLGSVEKSVNSLLSHSNMVENDLVGTRIHQLSGKLTRQQTQTNHRSELHQQTKERFAELRGGSTEILKEIEAVRTGGRSSLAVLDRDLVLELHKAKDGSYGLFALNESTTGG